MVEKKTPLISIKLYLLSTLFMCAIVSYLYNSNYNNNYSFVILICLQPFCKQLHLFIRSVYQSLQTTTFLLTSNVSSQKSDRITTDSLLPALSCFFICAYLQSDKYSRSRMFAFSLSRELYIDFIAFDVFCPYCLLCVRLYLFTFFMLM